MSNRTGQMILIGMFAGIILGAVGGYFAWDAFLKVRFLGVIFFNALQLVGILLAIFSLIVAVFSMGDIRKSGKLAGKTVLYFLATSGIAVLIGLVLVNVIRPGANMERYAVGVPEAIAQGKGMGLTDIISGLVPGNIFSAASGGALLGLVIFSVALGGALTVMGSAGKMVVDIFDTISKALMRLVQVIMYYAPVGVLALVGTAVAENRGSVGQLVSGMGLYVLAVVAGLLIQGIVVLPILLKVLGKKDPLEYVKNMVKPLTAAFVSASSTVALPLTMEAVIEKNKIDRRVGSFVIPFGAGVNFSGTALYEAVAVIFAAQAFGINLSIGQQGIVFITAALLSFGAAAIPHAGAITLSILFSAVGMPLETIGIVWGVDWFLDRFRTTVNVWGDAVGSAVIAETSEIRIIAVKPSAKIVSAEKRIERIEPKKPRYEKSERVPRAADRGDQQQRYRGQRREEPQRRPGRTGEGRQGEGRQGQFRGRQDFGHKGYREAPIPKEKIEQDLNRISKQLAVGSSVPEVIKETPAPAPAIETKKEDFFDKDFSKMDLAGETPKVEEPKPPEIVSKPEPEPELDKREEPPQEAEEKKGESEEKSSASSEEEDTWGRARKKHLGK